MSDKNNDEDSVVVFVLLGNGTASSYDLPHFDGVKVFDNGTLELRGGRNRISEIFAPGEWLRVKCLYDEVADEMREKHANGEPYWS